MHVRKKYGMTVAIGMQQRQRLCHLGIHLVASDIAQLCSRAINELTLQIEQVGILHHMPQLMFLHYIFERKESGRVPPCLGPKSSPAYVQGVQISLAVASLANDEQCWRLQPDNT